MAVLHTLRLGSPDGPPILAVHGITGHGGRFHRSATQGWPHRRTVAVDLRGHGHSLADPPWSIETHVGDLVDTLDALAADEPAFGGPVDVVGHSYGGLIALHLLAAEPRRIRRLVLLDPAIERPAAGGLQMAQAVIADPGWGSPEEARTARMTGLDPVAGADVDHDIATHLADDDAGRLRWRFSRPAVVTGWGELCRPLPELPVRRPTLLVRAERADIVSDDTVALLRSRLGGALEVTGVDCGHMVYWERFAETVAAVEGFLGD
jgi:lipase